MNFLCKILFNDDVIVEFVKKYKSLDTANRAVLVIAKNYELKHECFWREISIEKQEE